MSQRTKRLLTLFALAAAAAWFFWLRGAFSDISTSLRPAFRGSLDDPERIAQAGGLPYSPVQLRAQFGNISPRPDRPVGAQLEETTDFWVADEVLGETYQVTAALRYTGKRVLMYVDRNIEVDQAVLEKAARDFETIIYPRTRALFGEEASPGIDGDPRLTILHTPLASAGGYFSLADTQPLVANRYSNLREMFVIGADSYMPDDEGYLMILAHEFQHMIHAHQQPHSPAWFNEGLSMLAQDLNGFVDNDLAMFFLGNPDIGLTDWSQDASVTGEHYGAAQLFLRYFFAQYGGEGVLAKLIQADAGNRLEAFVRLAALRRADLQDFNSLVADWAVANLINEPGIADGRFAYEGLPAYVTPQELTGRRLNGQVNQLGADYLGVVEGPARLEFDGEQAVALTGAHPKAGDWMWWSGRGDARVATLTRAFDLRGVERATLEFFTWYEIERHFDYAYVTVSVDGGQTWQSLSGQTTSIEDPQGANLSNGFTGVSGSPGVDPEKGQRGRWVQERIDLTSFAGQQVLLRFWLVNDPAYNAQGLLLDEIRIPEIGYQDGAEEGEGGWQAEGFVRTTGGIPQAWVLRLVIERNGNMEVAPIHLDDENRAEIELAHTEQGVLVVLGASPQTDELARYQVKISGH